MKVCVINEREFGNGAAIAAHRVAEGLSDSGHEVYGLYSIRFKAEVPANYKKKFLGRNLKRYALYRSYSEQNLLKKLMMRAYEFWLRHSDGYKIIKWLEHVNPDVINMHNVGSVLTHRQIMQVAKKWPIVWTLHDQFAFRLYHNRWMNPDGEMETTWEPMFYFDSRLEDVKSFFSEKLPVELVAPSNWLKLRGEEVCKPNYEVHKIYNCISKKKYFNNLTLEQKRELRMKYDLPQKKIYVLFVADRITYSLKNFRTLVDALKVFREDVQIIAVGRPENISYKADFISYVGQSLSEEQMRDYYCLSDVLAIPSIIENLPNTILEAFMCGLPVMASNVGGIPEVVVPGKTGWLSEPKNRDTWLKNFTEILENPLILERYGENCLAYAKQNFSEEVVLGNYLELFKKLTD